MTLSSFRNAAIAAAILAPAATAQNLLTNPGFETPGLAGWGFFGNAHPANASPPNVVPHTGNAICTMFGNFSGGFDVSGIFQEFPTNPGDEWQMDCFTRHFSGDALSGTGPADFNWTVMKIAFFDGGGVEIGSAAVEANVLDGNSPTDQWIDHAPITATAPAGAINVQALVLFLQPFNDGGAAHIDDVTFGPVPAGPPTYPGNGDDVSLRSGVAGGATTTGGGNDVKTANGGDLLEFNVSSPGGTFDLAPYFLMTQAFATGSPPSPLPGLGFIYINPAQPFFTLVNAATGSPVGSSLIVGGGGTSSFYQAPAGMAGISVIVQAFPLSSAAINGVFGISEAHEIQFL